MFDIGTSSRDQTSSDPAGLTFTPITKEPFAVIVNPANPIKSLTKDQIKGIFTGSITNWSQVGWSSGGAIKIACRIGTSGTLATVPAAVPRRRGRSRPPPCRWPPTASTARSWPSKGNKNAISFVTYAYIAGTEDREAAARLERASRRCRT